MENNGPIVILYFCTAGMYLMSIIANDAFIKPEYRRWHTKQAVLLSVLLYGLPGSFLAVWLYEAAVWWAKLPDDDSQIKKNMMNNYMKKPCGNCPFRKDTLKGWLGEKRMKDILSAGSFVCHKSIEKSAAKGDDDSLLKQCAGHMILKGEGNDFVQLAQRINIPLGLKGQKLIFDSEEDCINHHQNQQSK